MPKVSIIMPACNVEKFIRECMDSVVNQTLKDIEIIVVNDGSKDSTGSILDEYAAKDDRVKVIHKVNTGYGNSMNVGLDHATGEYVGVVETDDYADLDMFEKLYEAAKKHDADVVKSNYYTYVSKPEPKSTYFEVLKEFDKYDEVFCPLDFQAVYRVRPCIWSGIYRRQMLVDNNVRFNETPGASYQDTSFAFKVWTSAERALLVKDAYLHYRVDNANSSVKSTAKIFCLCDEYGAIEAFLENHPEKKAKIAKMKAYLKYESYRWNLDRLTLEFKYVFLLRMREELLKDEKEGNLDQTLFMPHQWKRLDEILHNTDENFKELVKKELGGYDSVQTVVAENQDLQAENKKLKKRVKTLEQSRSYKLGRKLTAIPRKMKNSGKEA